MKGRVGPREAFDRVHPAPVRLDGEEKAGADGLAVHEHRAGAARPVLAAQVGARQREFLTEQVGE